MMLGHAPSLQAAGLTRHQMGLHGVFVRPRPLDARRGFTVMRPHRNLGAVDTEALKSIGADASVSFVSSGFDVDTLYEPAFAAASTLAMAIPQPYGLLVSLGIQAAKIGTDAIRGLIKTTMRASGQYLPLSVSEKVIKDIVSQDTADWWKRAAKDKFAEGAGDSFAISMGLAAFNAAASADNKLDLKVRTRVADKVYNVAKKYGATDWQAAMVAYKVCQNTGATDAKYKYAAIVGDVSNPEAAWKAKMIQIGGIQVDANQAEDIVAGRKRQPKTEATAGGPSPLLLGAGAVAALALLAR